MSWLAFVRKALPALLWLAVAIGWTATAYLAGAKAGAAKMYAEWQNERIANARAVANAIERQLDAENALTDALAARDLDHKKELDHVQTQHDQFVRDVRDGAIRLSIPVRAAACRAQGDAGAPAAGAAPEARAELDPAAAETLAGIARDGDSAIVDLNACIDRYNAVRSASNALSHAQAQ